MTMAERIGPSSRNARRRRRLSLFAACVLVTSVCTVVIVGVGGGKPASGQSTTASIPYVFGSNTFGQFGNGTTTASPTPTNVSTQAVSGSDPGFSDISAGGLHTLAVGTDGNLYSWGANDSGQLGQGDTTDRSNPDEISPSDFPSGTTFQEVAAGGSFSLALTSDGSAIWAWGSNMFGQLGDGSTTSSPTPVQVSTPNGVTFTSIAAGSDFALALSENGTVYAWGDDGLGELGDGSSGATAAVDAPQAIPSSDFGAGTVTQISAGNSDAFALASGTIYAWGDDDSGQLGNGQFVDSSTPVATNAPPSGTWTSVSAGSDFAIGLTSAGDVYAWGDNQFGELGNGDVQTNCSVGDPTEPTPYCSDTPVEVLVPPQIQFDAVEAGYSQGYALGANGAAWSWGNDQFGQLGDNGVGDPGNPQDAPAPTPEAVILPPGTNAAQLYSGSQASFGFLVTGQDQSWSSGFTPESKQWGYADFLLPAPTTSSGLPGDLTASGQCAITSEPQPGIFIVHILGAGTCAVTASQGGSNVYNPLPSISNNYQIGQAPLALIAKSVSAPQGLVPRSFSYSLGGFVNGDTAASAGVSGTASCSTSATDASPPGTYPINCTAGSLSAPNYSFSYLVAGTLTITPVADGYDLVASDGGIFSFGAAQFYGSTGALHLNQPIVGIADTPSGGGYWMVASDGGIFSFGNAQFYGSTGAIHLNQPIVGMTPTPDGGGYWLVASDGGIFAFGDAQFYGSTGAIHLNQPIVGMAATPDGGGYWLVASDGGIFAFGDAQFYGSTGAIHLNKPIVGMAATPDGGGYWMVASDGGIFTFGDAPFEGSAGGDGLTTPVVGMMRNPIGDGYWIATAAGGVYSFGSPFLGALLITTLNAPIAGIG
jgi:alpha-tubulin suppressor-like RCC1 family protein